MRGGGRAAGTDQRSRGRRHHVANSRGPGGTVCVNDHQTITRTYTNGAGLAVVDVPRTLSKDLKISRVGNTLTIVQLATGCETTHGPDGRVLARDPGQVRFRVVIDDNGTPADGSELSFEQIQGSTGRSDDFCGPVVAAIG